MNVNSILTSLFALVFVLSLIYLLAAVYKKYGSGAAFSQVKGEKRLKVREVLNIDAKKKIVLISRDGKEHLLAFNESKIEVIETNITRE